MRHVRLLAITMLQLHLFQQMRKKICNFYRVVYNTYWIMSLSGKSQPKQKLKDAVKCVHIKFVKAARKLAHLSSLNSCQAWSFCFFSIHCVFRSHCFYWFLFSVMCVSIDSFVSRSVVGQRRKENKRSKY